MIWWGRQRWWFYFVAIIVFGLVFTGHAAWRITQGGTDCAPACATEVGDDACATGFDQYVATGGYWLGYSYALPLAFASVALRRYREQRMCRARTLAIGGVAFSGFLAVAACFLLGCCGSPMLAVYLSLFGAAFLPLAKLLIAAITTVLILGGSWWLRKHWRKQT